jgi:hypothetical protein
LPDLAHGGSTESAQGRDCPESGESRLYPMRFLVSVRISRDKSSSLTAGARIRAPRRSGQRGKQSRCLALKVQTCRPILMRLESKCSRHRRQGRPHRSTVLASKSSKRMLGLRRFGHAGGGSTNGFHHCDAIGKLPLPSISAQNEMSRFSRISGLVPAAASDQGVPRRARRHNTIPSPRVDSSPR